MIGGAKTSLRPTRSGGADARRIFRLRDLRADEWRAGYQGPMRDGVFGTLHEGTAVAQAALFDRIESAAG